MIVTRSYVLGNGEEWGLLVTVYRVSDRQKEYIWQSITQHVITVNNDALSISK